MFNLHTFSFPLVASAATVALSYPAFSAAVVPSFCSLPPLAVTRATTNAVRAPPSLCLSRSRAAPTFPSLCRALGHSRFSHCRLLAAERVPRPFTATAAVSYCRDFIAPPQPVQYPRAIGSSSCALLQRLDLYRALFGYYRACVSCSQ